MDGGDGFRLTDQEAYLVYKLVSGAITRSTNETVGEEIGNAEAIATAVELYMRMAEAMTEDDPCAQCGGEGWIDDPLSSACGGRWFRYCECEAGVAASEKDREKRKRAVMPSLEKRLWDSDQSSPLTHEAAREIERLKWRLDRLNRAMPEALALIMFDDLKRQYDASRAFGIRWLDGAAGVNDVEVEGHVDLVSLAREVITALKETS